ncbi:MAG: hypothetical protein R3Y24_14635 [Eubacteriales bacterium]
MKKEENKKSVVLIILLILVSFILFDIDCDEEEYSSIILMNNNSTQTIYVNGENMTEEIQNTEELMKENICTYLHISMSEVEFRYFCMLENDGATIEALIEGQWYTFLCNMQGELQSEL